MTTTSVPSGTTCHRHPDRVASFECQNCGRPICADCNSGASQDVSGCDPALTVAGRGLVPARFQRPYVALSLIVANVAVAIACVLSDSSWLNGELGTLARRGALVGGAVLVSRDGLETVGVAHGEWYRIVTAAFLHGGPIHLAFNMIALWQAGLLLEGRVGRLRFGLIYAVAVLGGGFGALLLSPEAFAVGASGGVFGLFGALFVAERKGLFGRAGSSFGVLIAINLFLTLAIPGISLGGHVGGLIAGTFTAWTMVEYQSRGLPRTVPVVLCAALGTGLFVGCLWAASLSSDPLYRI